MSYLTKVLIALDQLANALMNGAPDETMSAACYRYKERSLWRLFLYRAVNMLFFWQEDHCKAAFISELERRHLGKGYNK